MRPISKPAAGIQPCQGRSVQRVGPTGSLGANDEQYPVRLVVGLRDAHAALMYKIYFTAIVHFHFPVLAMELISLAGWELVSLL